jgi:hypothetical protein
MIGLLIISVYRDSLRQQIDHELFDPFNRKVDP